MRWGSCGDGKGMGMGRGSSLGFISLNEELAEHREKAGGLVLLKDKRLEPEGVLTKGF